MIVKKKPLLYFFVSLLGSVLGHVLSNSVRFGICTADETGTDVGCILTLNRIGDPLFYGMAALVVIFLVLYFLPKAWDTWKKFALWFVPITAVLFIVYPEPESWDLPQEPVFKFISGVYVVVSLLIILYSSLRKKS